MASRLRQMLDNTIERLETLPPVERVRGLFESLSPRDRVLLTFLLCFFVVLGLGGAAMGVRSSLRRMEADIATRQEQLARAADVQAEYSQLKKKVEDAENRLKAETDFAVQSFLERQTGSAGISAEQLAAIEVRAETPGTWYTDTQVELKLKKVGLQSLTTFLYGIEYGDRPISVKSLRVRPDRRDRAQLDVEMELTVLTLKEGT